MPASRLTSQLNLFLVDAIGIAVMLLQIRHKRIHAHLINTRVDHMNDIASRIPDDNLCTHDPLHGHNYYPYYRRQSSIIFLIVISLYPKQEISPWPQRLEQLLLGLQQRALVDVFQVDMRMHMPMPMLLNQLRVE